MESRKELEATPACVLSSVHVDPLPLEGLEVHLGEGGPLPHGGPLQGTSWIPPVARCLCPARSPGGVGVRVGGLQWDLGALPKNDPHPNSRSWAAAPWPQKRPKETCLDMCSVY